MADTSQNEPTIVTKLQRDWTWLTHHVTTLVISGALTLGSIYFIENFIQRHDQQTEQKYATILTAQQQLVTDMKTNLAARETQWQAQMTALLNQNQQLTRDITTRNSQLAEQVKTNATLSAQQAAARILEQTNAASGEVTAQGDNVVLDLPVSRTVVSNLDELPVVKANLADTQKQLTNETQIAATTEDNLAAQKNLNAALQTQMTDADNACKAQVKTLKAEARKSKLKWGTIMTIVGYIAGKVL